MIDCEELVKMAINVKEQAYAPYSKFKVGAVLVTQNNKIYTGVNIENATYGATVCAERTAILKAVSEGERKIIKIIIASDSIDYIYPCGICRQMLAEFGNDDMEIICTKNTGEYIIKKLGELLPNAFRLLEEIENEI